MEEIHDEMALAQRQRLPSEEIGRAIRLSGRSVPTAPPFSAEIISAGFMAWLPERRNRVFSRLDVIRGNLLSLGPASGVTSAGSSPRLWVGDRGVVFDEVS